MNVPPVRLTPFIVKALMWAGGLALLISVGFGGVQSFRLANARTNLAEEKRERAEDTGAARVELDNLRAEYRRREDTWNEALRKATRDADKEISEARADAGRADAVRERLQQRVESLLSARRAPDDSAASGSCEAADAAARVLADVFRRADETAGRMAALADERGAAGRLCERAYSTLTDEGEGQVPVPVQTDPE